MPNDEKRIFKYIDQKQEVTMKKIITLLFVLLMLISMTGCKKKEEPKEEVDTSKHYEIKIIDNNAAESGANIATESEVLSAVLEEIAKIGMLKYETEKGDDGWYISSVNDVKADDKGNWAVYLNSELCKQGIDKVTLKDGDLIEIVYIPAAANAQPETTPMVGGWTTYEKTSEMLGDDEKEVFAKGLEGLTGVGYEPIRVLAMQVVSGKNYAFLAKGTLVTAEPETDYYIITVYEDLDGKCEFKAINKIDVTNLETTTGKNEQLLGGWTVISGGKPGYFSEEKIQDSFDKAVKDKKDMVFSPIQLLATQLVAGTNYLALCFGKVTDGSDADVYFVRWYEDLQGNSTLDSVETCNLQYYITGE